MEHLDEVEDAAARDGVNTFKTQMEVVVLSLLSENRTKALTQIEDARVATLEHTGDMGSRYLSASERAKSGRVALGMLRHTFGRLRHVIQWPDEEDDAPLSGPSL